MMIVAGRIANSILPVQVAFLTNTREYLVMARHNLIPQWLAHVNKTTGTPIRISLIYGAAACEKLSLCPISPIIEPSTLVMFLGRFHQDLCCGVFDCGALCRTDCVEQVDLYIPHIHVATNFQTLCVDLRE